MIDLANTFAKYLDNNEFSKATEMMAGDCVYKFRDQIITGSEKIIECYQGSFDSVADQLDEILFESQVEQLEPQLFKLHFTDKISKNGNSFEHKCEQTIRFAGDKVVEIQHFDLPGETDKLNAFFKENGIVRKPIANLTFRKAHPSEAQLLSDLAIHSKGYYDYPKDYLEKCIPALTVKPSDIDSWPFVVVVVDGAVKGFFALMKVKDEHRLEHLWLSPEMIGKGVGRFLFPRIIEEARELKWESFRLVADPKAQGFYEKMGLKTIGMTQSKIAPDIYLPHMEYKIG